MKAVGIILAGGSSNKLKALARKRAAAAMPIAGSYRAIDFTLSNMSNSHMSTVAVLTQYNSRSLSEHLSSAKWWDFGRKQGGLYVFTPTITSDNSFWFRGTADAICQNLDFLKNGISHTLLFHQAMPFTRWTMKKCWNTMWKRKQILQLFVKS